jgi:hypothetical protein
MVGSPGRSRAEQSGTISYVLSNWRPAVQKQGRAESKASHGVLG